MVNPRTNSITHNDIKSQIERHTINTAELAAIVVALKQEHTKDHMSILTDSSFFINTIRNYTIDPAAYNQHMYKDLLQLTNQLLKDRDHKQPKTHIGKVKSHTDVEHNETADKAARAVVDGANLPGITFEEADPPIGGLRTWPQIRLNPTDKPKHIRKLTNLKTCIKKNSRPPRKPRPRRASTGSSYKRQETREQTSAYIHTHNPHIDPDETDMKWHGNHMSTDAKRSNTNPDQ
jgi:ribonuclease HI